jgi:hypothetical protein
MTPKCSFCSSHVDVEGFKVKVYFENISKTFITSSKPLIINNEAIVIKSDNGNEYYYKLSMINGYEIEKLPF